MHISVNIIFKNHYVLIGKYIFIIFLSIFVIKNIRGTCSSVKMVKACMARESLVTPALDPREVQMASMAINAKNSICLRWQCPWWRSSWLAVGFGCSCPGGSYPAGSCPVWQLYLVAVVLGGSHKGTGVHIFGDAKKFCPNLVLLSQITYKQQFLMLRLKRIIVN